MITGEYQHNLDSKGRVFVPAKLREELGDVFYITVSMEHCLNIYSATEWKSFSDRIALLPYVKQIKLRPLFAFASKCELDTQGRIIIPLSLRNYAGLVKTVTVLGCNTHAEIWDTDTWAAVAAEEMKPENIAAVMEALEF